MKTVAIARTAVFSALFALAPVFVHPAHPEFSLSGGGGVLLGGLFTDYIIDADENTNAHGRTVLTMTQNIKQFNFGGFVFFDATYGEFALTIQHGINSYKEDVDAEYGSSTLITTREGTGSETMLGLCLLGKYPFQIGERLVIYPLAGIEYQIALTEKRKPDGGKEQDRIDGNTEFPRDEFTLSLWNSFFIKIGAGLDFYFRSPWYFKTELLYSIRLMIPYEKAAVDYLKKDFDISEPKLFTNPGMRGLTHGPELRLAMGYRFK